MKGTLMTAIAVAVGLTGLAFAGAGRAGGDESSGPAGVRELTVPPDWQGRWSFRLETRDPGTGALTAVDEGGASICGGDALGLSLYLRKSDDGTACSGGIDGNELRLTCAASFDIGQCRVGFRIDTDVTRTFDTMTGTGEWRVVETAGECGDILAHVAGESLRLTAVRSHDAGADCAAPPASLVEKLLQQPQLTVLMPAPIESLEASRDGTSIRLAWTRTPAKAYEVQRSIDGGRFRPIAEVAGHLNTFRDRNLEPHREYRYIVRWIAADGRMSPASNEARVQL